MSRTWFLANETSPFFSPIFQHPSCHSAFCHPGYHPKNASSLLTTRHQQQLRKRERKKSKAEKNKRDKKKDKRQITTASTTIDNYSTSPTIDYVKSDECDLHVNRPSPACHLRRTHMCDARNAQLKAINALLFEG